MRATNALLAELLAVYHNVNFRDANKEHLKLTARNFLADPDAVGDDEDDEGEEGEEAAPSDAEVARIVAAHDDLRAAMGLGAAPVLVPLIPRPNVAPVPAGLFAMLTGGGEVD